MISKFRLIFNIVFQISISIFKNQFLICNIEKYQKFDDGKNLDSIYRIDIAICLLPIFRSITDIIVNFGKYEIPLVLVELVSQINLIHFKE